MTGKDLIKIILDSGADKEVKVQRASMVMEVKPCDIRTDESQIIITE